MLASVERDLEARGIRLRIVEAVASVRDVLRAEGLEERVGKISRRVSVGDVVEEHLGELT
jgi:hypothetical protein